MEPPPIPFVTFISAIFILLTTLPNSFSQENDAYSVCSQPFSCGSLTNISYPFWGQNRPGYCGIDEFELKCSTNQNTFIQVGSQNFDVLQINQTANTLRMVRTDLADGFCSPALGNTSLNGSFFQYLPSVQNFTLFYNCSSEEAMTSGKIITCKNDNNSPGFYVNETDLLQLLSSSCGARVEVPFTGNFSEAAELSKALEEGFEVEYINAESSKCIACSKSGGRCGTKINNTSLFSCHCPGGTDDTPCPSSSHDKCNECRKSGGVCGSSTDAPFVCYDNNSTSWIKIVIGVTSAAVSALLLCIGICCWCMPSIRQRTCWNMKSNDTDIETFIRNQGTLALRRYKFSDVKKMTNSFKVKLGQGGFGVVYKGKLVTGSPVAVKILNASKENGQEFINEVASISRTSHVNVVALLGFCFEGRKKALIYEFMANGSLDKFIYSKTDDGTSLSWENLCQIAVGIARGLEYLHRGCNTRIFHFDIKPHNILLDENFCPKISDFGLAKLCLTRESIISMSDPRGTFGYIAPEVSNKNFGGVSHKSDVYSYGMMLLDMAGGRKNNNAEINQTSEIYFPDWIYKKLELGLELDGVTTSQENDIAKRMTLVALWCIQTMPGHRPTMSRVIEMLEGSLDSLEMPPKPVLSSPTRSTPKLVLSSARSTLESSTT